ncbi:MAG: hypothetical protein KGL01_09820, partial [Betaproteobacteria bacterium]|nr:hypothetical protein [Betaproteobacteria bacterium]
SAHGNRQRAAIEEDDTGRKIHADRHQKGAAFIIPDNPPIPALATLLIPIKRCEHRHSGLDPESSRNKYRRA